MIQRFDALAFGAHPDDVEVAMGETIAKLSDKWVMEEIALSAPDNCVGIRRQRADSAIAPIVKELIYATHSRNRSRGPSSSPRQGVGRTRIARPVHRAKSAIVVPERPDCSCARRRATWLEDVASLSDQITLTVMEAGAEWGSARPNLAVLNSHDRRAGAAPVDGVGSSGSDPVRTWWSKACSISHAKWQSITRLQPAQEAS